MVYAIVNLSDHVTIFHCQLSVYLLQESENMQIIDALGFMAIPLMEFIELLNFENWCNVEVSKSAKI